MKKKKKSIEQGTCLSRNPVAKFASQFNKAQFFKDKTKYQRRSKHKDKEPFPMILIFIGKGFFDFNNCWFYVRNNQQPT